MPDLPGMPSSIRCAACGFENTTTSLYCQDCGVRLVPPPSAIAAEESPTLPKAAAAPVRSKPRILSTHRPDRAGSYLIIAIRTLILAALAALVIQILRPPADLPPAAAPLTEQVVNNVRAALQACAQKGAPFDAQWSGQGLNAYLAAILQPSAAGNPFHVAFQRALLAPAEGGFSLFVERKVAALTLYSKIDYQLVSRGNGIDIVPVSATLGRLPLPAWLAPGIESLNGGLDQALASELEILRQAKSVRITAQKASVSFGSPRP